MAKFEVSDDFRESMFGRTRLDKLAERDLVGIPEAVADVGGERGLIHQPHGEQRGSVNLLARCC